VRQVVAPAWRRVFRNAKLKGLRNAKVKE